ncbi:hypothetical protein [Nocardioides sp.]|uniref:hypothetical protein n=1 Tax=Nocardioides sp. TaxID=35761 RepID=UPI0039E4C311
MSFVEKIRATTACAVVGAGMVLLAPAPAARAAGVSDAQNYAEYALASGTGSYDSVTCTSANRVNHSWSTKGTDVASLGSSSDGSKQLVGVSTGVVGASFTSDGTLQTTSSLDWDGSRGGSIAFRGNATVQVTDPSQKCQGYGGTEADYYKVLVAERSASFTITVTTEAAYQWAYLDVDTYAADGSASSKKDVYDYAKTITSAGPSVTYGTTIRLAAGEAVTFRGSSSVEALASYGYGGNPVVYSGSERNQLNGGATVTYSLALDPAPGQQSSPTTGKAADTAVYPTTLGCGTKSYTFSPKKPKKLASVRIYANGKKLKTVRHPKKVVRVKLRKTKATKLTFVYTYKSGKKRTVVKHYRAC